MSLKFKHLVDIANLPIVSQPKLNAPNISLTDETLTITNPSTNGNFCSAFKVFVDGVLKLTQTSNTIDLTTVIEDSGTYNITVKCSGTNFEDSADSNSVEYVYSAVPVLSYFGTPTALSVARSSLAATTVGNYALFGGGEANSEGDESRVDAYIVQ